MTAVVETEHLTRVYGARVVVDRIGLLVPAGAVYGFLGPNGAGKTTTLRLLLGLVRPTAGTVRVFGLPMPGRRRAVLARVGALIEEPSLYAHLTGRENLEITRRLRDLPRAAVDRALALVGLSARDAARPARQYSQGMRQRLGLALALLPAPDLLVLDEPTNGLDPAGIRAMRDLVGALHREHGLTVLLSSHLLAEVEHVATHVGVLHQGRLHAQGALADVQALGPAGAVLRVADPPRAAAALAAQGIAANGCGPQLVLPGAASDAAVAAAIRVLVTAGLDVYGAARARPSLEGAFLQITATATAGREGGEGTDGEGTPGGRPAAAGEG